MTYINWVEQSLGTGNSNEPVRKNSYLFEIYVDEPTNERNSANIVATDPLWNVKEINIPKISFDAGSSLVDGVSFFGDGFVFKDKKVIMFDNLEVTFYNIPKQANDLSTYAYLLSLISEITKNRFKSKIEQIKIKTINPIDDKVLETFILKNPNLISLSLDSLSYESDELSTIKATFEFSAMDYVIGSEGEKDKVLSLYSDNYSSRITSLASAGEEQDQFNKRTGIIEGYTPFNGSLKDVGLYRAGSVPVKWDSRDKIGYIIK